MRRGAKPAKGKVEPKLSVARKSRESEGSRIHDLEKRLAELQEQQAATAEILRVISSSPTDPQPVFDMIAESVVRLCDGVMSGVYRFDGSLIHFVAHHNWTDAGLATARRVYPKAPDRDTQVATAILDRAVLEVRDFENDPKIPAGSLALARALGYRSDLVVPMLLQGNPIGAIAVARAEAGPFSVQQLALLKTFADQAVIAIENVRLFNETKEALERQMATSEILQVIATSPTDVQPVLDALVESVGRLCEAADTFLLLVEGDQLRVAALHPPVEGGVISNPIQRGWVAGRAVMELRTVHVEDLANAQSEFPLGWEIAVRLGHRTALAMPLVRKGEPIGALFLRRREVRQFSDKEIALLQTFADQAVIAIENVRLFNELQEKNSALTTAHAQVSEALEQQTATSEVLKVISRSAFDLQPVLDTLIENAVRLCGADRGFIHRQDGEFYPVAASYGHTPEWVEVVKRNPIRGDRTSATGRAALERRVIHIPDILADPEYRWAENQRGQEQMHRTVLSVPMLREGAVIGVITIRRTHVQSFTDKQVDLVTTFADQAVIAIENVRLFKELEARNGALSEALDQQTATGEILRAISQSQTDTQPVFEAIADSALRLFRAWTATVFRVEGEFLVPLAARGGLPGSGEASQYRQPQKITRESVSGRCIVDRAVVHVADVQTDADAPSLTREIAPARGFRSALGVPLLRDGQAIGTIAVSRVEPGPFSDSEIALLKTFADQAVIAIENVRLFTELQEKNRALTSAHGQISEAFERQTATADILSVISRSPKDVQPVFDAIVERAARLCDAVYGAVVSFDGERVRLEATRNWAPEVFDVARRFVPAPPSRSVSTGRAILERTVVHLPDVERDPEYLPEIARAGSFRSILAVPMLRDGVPLGAITVGRVEPGPFSDNQITLLQTFADQAVIAIENVRLFKDLEASNRELRVALEQQTATSELLKVIGRSTFDLQPVFETLAENAVRLCAATQALIMRFDGQVLRPVVTHNLTPENKEFLEQNPIAPGRGSASGRAALERRTIHIHDVQSDPEYTYGARQLPFRSLLALPMLRADELLGVIVIQRDNEVRPFTDNQIALMETFAGQAAIAIENVRLLSELQVRTHDLTRSVGELRALGEVGQAISSTLDLRTVLSTIVARATQLSGTDAGVIYEYDEQREVFVPQATAHLEAEIVETMLATPVRKGEGATGRLAEIQEPIQVPDILAAPAESRVRGALVRAGYRALLAVPLVRDDHLLGGLTVIRKATGAFAPEVIELLTTFATQSALAIQNARLFREIEEKSRQLEVASQHKSEFLANMSHELRTPLNAIIGFSEVLTERMFGELNEKQEEYLKDIYASGTHLLSLINDILDLSKIEAGRMELELTDFHLPTALDSALTLVRERAGRRGIAVQLNVDERLGQVRADERKVRQVVLNLLSNAIKFTPEGGSIEVRAVPKDGLVEVSVSDTGVGIAPADQEAVFEEFRQVGTAEKRAEGTGLGLTLCRKFIELHGGRIWVKSQIGAGSTFTFTIPVRCGE